ncbi:phosphatidate cytidylyltransferase [Thermaerobacter composti]|uniref:Phosphatidate cytidylyltransferase n=1 Tax=Thermaerobacter composti TaxID=554949 RepID=A0ABZ0QRA8_9FIRM|nr:phosphatidate cytidylyltransferase [Thermaerobacter composti]WPD19996.1 phosphatidate cytidylyltransferase [Thermaerobacter composti]
MLTARLATAAVLLPPVLAAVWWGGGALTSVLGAVGLLAGWEAAGLLAEAMAWAGGAKASRAGWRRLRAVGAVAGILPMGALALLPWPPAAAMAAAPLAAAVVGAAAAAPTTAGAGSSAGPLGGGAPGPLGGMSAGLLGGGPAASLRGGVVAAGVAAWVGIPLACALWLRQAGPAWLLVPLIILWVQDTAAFFVGRAWGRRPLAPRISPGKTWEGAAGGLAGALVAAALLAGLLDRSALELLPAAAGTAVAGQLGDLWESWWKRRAGRKDSGSLLPGHGGMLDRIDSLLPALVLFAAWMRPWR